MAFGQVDGKNEDKDCTNKENNFGLTIDQFINICLKSTCFYHWLGYRNIRPK